MFSFGTSSSSSSSGRGKSAAATKEHDSAHMEGVVPSGKAATKSTDVNDGKQHNDDNDNDNEGEDEDEEDLEVSHPAKNPRLHEPSLHVSPAKGILKNSNPNLSAETENLVNSGKKPRDEDSEPYSGRRKSIKWDEEKLQETESQRGQATMKITEPKTPYIYYNQDTDQVFGASHENLTNAMPPLELSTAVHEAISKMDTEEPPKKYEDWEDDRDNKDNPDHPDHPDFKKHRMEHYNMKKALAKARELIASEEELNDDE